MPDFDPRIFQSLRSSDPEERKKGVKALAQTGEREAMRYLATIYKQDPDSSVRQLALDAGKHIKRLLIQGDWVGEGVKTTQEMMSPQSSISEADQKAAKKLMDDALTLADKQEYERAEELVRQAFTLNPDMQYDMYFTGIAGTVMGIPPEEAVAKLLPDS